MEEIYFVLESFGLTNNEVKTYLAILRAGCLTASEISSKTGIHRINVYDILNKLGEKGIVSQIKTEKQKLYEAIHPKEFKKILNERARELDEIIPELTKQMNIAKSPQEATLIKTKKGIKQILQDSTNSKTNILLFASANYSFKKFFPEYHEIWPQRIFENKKQIQVLQNPSQKGSVNNPAYNIRVYPKNFSFPSTTIIWDDNVFTIIWETGPSGILIRNKAVSESYKNFFEMIWQISKK
jgi:sugar-specific transcriptional regulator TrmB